MLKCFSEYNIIRAAARASARVYACVCVHVCVRARRAQREGALRIFGKEKSKVKSEQLGRLGMIVVTGILLVLVSICSFAWFSNSRTSGGNGLGVVVSTQNFELLVERTARYESGYPIITSTDGVKDTLLDEEYDFTEVATGDSPRLAYELVNEYEYESKYNLMPGAYGTLTFYLRPLGGVTNLNVAFKLAIGGFVTTYDEQGENATFGRIAEDSVVLSLLRGHILFFESRTGSTIEDYVYGGLIEDGTFSYDTSTHSLCDEVGRTDCYKITLYWEWPITYIDITDNISTASVTRRFPAAMADYLEDHGEYFFLQQVSGSDVNEMSDAYNDADQAIGTGAQSIVVTVTAA